MERCVAVKRWREEEGDRVIGVLAASGKEEVLKV